MFTGRFGFESVSGFDIFAYDIFAPFLVVITLDYAMLQQIEGLEEGFVCKLCKQINVRIRVNNYNLVNNIRVDTRYLNSHEFHCIA